MQWFFLLSSQAVIPRKTNLFSILFSLENIHIQIVANCKIMSACLCLRLHNCCGEWEGWDPVNWFNHTGWVTPTDRPKSVRNRYVIKVLVAFLCCHVAFGFSVGVGAFVIGLSQISSFFPCILQLERTLCLRLTRCNEILSNFLWSRN